MWPFTKPKPKPEIAEVESARRAHDEATAELDRAVKARDVLKELLDSKKKEDEDHAGR